MVGAGFVTSKKARLKLTCLKKRQEREGVGNCCTAHVPSVFLTDSVQAPSSVH